jgi:acyl-CoA synthetase (AMP-forming)/AMP-acid ligase II
MPLGSCLISSLSPVVREGVREGEVLPDILLGRRDRLDETAIVSTNGIRTRRVTWRQLSSRVVQVADELRQRRIGAGDRVILWGENGPAWVAAFYAILLRGAVVVPLDQQSAPDFVARVVAQVEPRLALVGGNGQESLPASLPQLLLEQLEALIDRYSGDPGRLGSLEEGQGADRLASQLRIPVVPPRIDTLFDLTRQRRYFSRPGTVTAHIGQPVEYGIWDDPALITKDLERRVRSL